ncbi:MAG: hypothetical protein EAZ92_05680 [Candidatus Kapaibacterium sp.]|nr:MAG: hypothetical protein EAZ92_05680 [Candidatus Kapabacteria bacterium]
MKPQQISRRQPRLSLPLVLAALLLTMLVSSCELFQPAQTDKFGYRTGDYTVYDAVELDTSNNPTPKTYRVSRSVVRTGVTLGGQSDAILVRDSTFTSGASPRIASVDTLYYRVANDEVFYYFDINAVGRIIRRIASSFGATVDVSTLGIMGLEPKWIKIAELRDAAGMDFPSADFSASAMVPMFGSLSVGLKVTGKNQGVVTQAVGSNSYRAHRQAQSYAISTAIPLAGTLRSSASLETDYGIPAQQNTPRTIIRLQENTVVLGNIPIIGRITAPGERRTISSFRAGTTF